MTKLEKRESEKRGKRLQKKMCIPFMGNGIKKWQRNRKKKKKQKLLVVGRNREGRKNKGKDEVQVDKTKMKIV